MSVNAINAADAQQQPKKSNAGTAVTAGVGLGAAGAIGGYFHKKTPSLEEVFAQEPDTFKTTHETLKGKDETAAGTVKTEYDKMQKEIESEAKAAKKAEDAMNNAIEKVSDYDNKAELDKAVTQKQKDLNNTKKTVSNLNGEGTRENVDYKTVKKELEAAQNKVDRLKPTDTDEAKATAKKELETAKANMAEFDEAANALEEAKKNKFNAQKAKFDAAAATEGSKEAQLKTAATEAADELKSAKERAIGKLKDNNTLTDAFGKVKKALAEVSWKRVGLYGGIAAAVGLLAGAMLGGKKEA